MNDFEGFFDVIKKNRLEKYHPQFEQALQKRFFSRVRGDWPAWQASFDRLPDIQPSQIILDQDTISIGRRDDCNSSQREQLREALMGLHPWRKGPYDLFEVFIGRPHGPIQLVFALAFVGQAMAMTAQEIAPAIELRHSPATPIPRAPEPDP